MLCIVDHIVLIVLDRSSVDSGSIEIIEYYDDSEPEMMDCSDFSDDAYDSELMSENLKGLTDLTNENCQIQREIEQLYAVLNQQNVQLQNFLTVQANC